MGKNREGKMKRRFNDDQIKSLEVMFESETRLEPQKKMELASELGLQPRQVAIWFQNKRARWKSKQLEREYSVLTADYNTLSSRFQAVEKEKQSLISRLQKLNEVMKKTEDERRKNGRQGIITDHDAENVEETTRFETEANQNISVGRSEHGIGVMSDDDSMGMNTKTEYLDGFQEEEKRVEVMNIVEMEPTVSSLTSTEDWGNFESDGLFGQSSSSYGWWDFWSS